METERRSFLEAGNTDADGRPDGRYRGLADPPVHDGAPFPTAIGAGAGACACPSGMTRR